MILIVEDNKADVFLIRESIQTAQIDATLQVLSDGEQAVRFFEQADQEGRTGCPALVILDINLPKRSGADVLRRVRQSARCRNVPVLVVTSSNSEADRVEMGGLEVKGYFQKPSDYAAFMKLGGLVKALVQPPVSN